MSLNKAMVIGHLTRAPRVDAVVMERFWRYLPSEVSTDECWNWTGHLSPTGYGRFRFRGKHFRAHRFAWVAFVGEIDGGIFVLHKCDNPRCVNPAHLFLGTHDDNMADKVQKNRQARGLAIVGNRNTARGERAGRPKLKEADIKDIRASYRKEANAAIARRYGVSKVLVGLIMKRKAWKHVADNLGVNQNG